MPNYCSNNVTFTHDDPAMIQRVVDAYNADRLFREFFPCPVELAEASSPNDKNPDEMIAKYDAPDWYAWCVNNWGTKWDVASVDEVAAEGNSVTVYFDSAWSPPLEFYINMEDQLGFRIKAYYWEPAMQFCGIFEDGQNKPYDIKGDSAWVRENIPSELDEMFSISDSMEEWAADNK